MARALWIATAACGLVACASIEGLGDLQFDRTSGGAGPTSSTSSSAMSSSSSSMGIEDCTNGVDDNGDAKVDCADPACTALGYSCEAIPAGFEGPVVLYDGMMAAPPCPPGFEKAYEGGLAPTAPATMCDACSCDDAPVTCSAGALHSYTMTNCAAGGTSQPQPSGCIAFALDVLSAQAETPNVTGGLKCAATGGAPTLPAASFSEIALACKPVAAGGGCDPGSVCAPAAPGGAFGSGLCVFATGDQPCDAAWSKKKVFADGIDDTRDCTPCQCDDSTDATCTGTTTFFTSASCKGSLYSFPDDGSCHNPPSQLSPNSFNVSTMGTGTCASSGGAPTGGLAESAMTTTLCCKP